MINVNSQVFTALKLAAENDKSVDYSQVIENIQRLLTDEYALVSEQVKHSLHEYATNRHSTGGFLRAVLENDLAAAVSRADNENFPAIPQIMKYVYNKLPADSWGSKEAVDAWLAYREPNPGYLAPLGGDEPDETECEVETIVATARNSKRNRRANCPFCNVEVQVGMGYEGLECSHEGCVHVLAIEDGKEWSVVFHRPNEKDGAK